MSVSSGSVWGTRDDSYLDGRDRYVSSVCHYLLRLKGTAMTVVHLIAAARPNFMKIGPLWWVLSRQDWCKPVLVHTGQHYDAAMSDNFFRDLGIPRPSHNLEIGSGTHAEQTAGVMVAYERLCLVERPDWVVVVGDVNSTLACTLAAKKLLLPVAHLEAGLRSGDRSMPEEINRLATDVLADLLWTPSPDGDANLLREGVPAERIERVGNIMIDSYEKMRPAIQADGTPESFGLTRGGYGVVTLHRPSNVDSIANLAPLVEALVTVSANLPLILPVHPRTRARLEQFGLLSLLIKAPGIVVCEPLSYIPFMALVSAARMVLTDSGGVQEETSYLGIPCLTLRENTERPITVELGTNRLVRTDTLLDSVAAVLDGRWPKGESIPLWDGHTAERVADSLRRAAGKWDGARSESRKTVG